MLLEYPPNALGGGVEVVLRVLAEELEHDVLAGAGPAVHVGEGATSVDAELKAHWQLRVVNILGSRDTGDDVSVTAVVD